MTIEQASEAVDTLNTSDSPDLLVLHTLTNDLKTSAGKCVEDMKKLISKIHTSLPDTKVLISLATPRKDHKKYQQNVDLVNALLRSDIEENDQTYFCDHTNLANRGIALDKFYARDEYHLSDEGIAVFANNLRRCIDKILHIPRYRPRNGSRSPTHDRSPVRQGNRSPRRRPYRSTNRRSVRSGNRK